MSIPNTINLIEEHIENAYDALETGGADLTNVNKNLMNISSQLIDRYEDYLANGTDIIWDNWENKSTQEGKSLNFNNTIEAKININLKGNASQADIPTPNTPQDIHVVTGNNTLQVVGKNLLDPNSVIASSGVTYSFENNILTVSKTISASTLKYIDYEFPVKEGDIVKFSSIIQSSSGQIVMYDYTTSWTTRRSISYTDGKTAGVVTYTIPSGVSRIRFYVYSNNTVTTELVSSSYKNFIVTINDGDIAYEPYTSQTQLLSLGNIELVKIGDYQDRIYKQDGKWYKQGNITKLIFNGSADENWGSWTEGVFRSNIDRGLAKLETFPQPLLCNYYKPSVTGSVSTSNNGDVWLSINDGYIRLKNTEIAFTTAGINTWLSTHNTILYVPLATPTTTEITDTILIEQLNNLEKLKSYYNKTNIFQENADIPFIINATILLNE